jgi:membrane associated rhomboid family serine protease
LFWFAALALFYFFGLSARTDFKAAGVMDKAAVLHGEWWRLFTAVTLHADLAHLAANAATGVIFLGLAMGCFGAGHALLLSFLGGGLGFLGSLAVRESPYLSIGASGMVMASLGLITAHSLIFAREEKPTLWIGRSMIAGCLLVVHLGLSPRSDVTAHLSGFLNGLGLGFCALSFGDKLRRPGSNFASLCLCCGLVTVTWWQALR